MARTNLVRTQVVKCTTDVNVPPNENMSMGQPIALDGYRYMNICVQFDQQNAEDPPVDVSALFAFDTQNTMAARCYANLEENLTGPQSVNAIEVSGAGSWQGVPPVSCYVARIPVLAPYAWLFALNNAQFVRKVSVWVYLVA